jgi:hypothetical protein
MMRILAAAALAACGWGCTAESTRVALEAQRRADEVQRAVCERQHDGLRVLLYRDTLRRLMSAASAEDTAAVLSEAWNERDLVEFWLVQHERAAALHLAAVDTKLYADQSPIDLLLRQLSVKQKRLEQGLAAAKGAALGD